MKKAPAAPITAEAIYSSMIAAYTGGNIGEISNSITKIWNSHTGVDLDVVKLLCLENNFVIDYAKTLYKPTRPKFADDMIRNHTQGKVPYFFMEAKGKSNIQVAPINDSCVNRIRHIIPVRKLDFSAKTLGRFDYKMLLHNRLVPSNEVSQKIIDTYRTFVRSKDNKIGVSEDGRVKSLWRCQCLVDHLLSIHGDLYDVVDVLVKEIFYVHPSKRKAMFWICFGDIVAENIKSNLGCNSGMCIRCGRRFYRESGRQQMCHACAEQSRRLSDRMRKRNIRKNVRIYKKP